MWWRIWCKEYWIRKGWVCIVLAGISNGNFNNYHVREKSIRWAITSGRPIQDASCMLMLAILGTGEFSSAWTPSIPQGSTSQWAGALFSPDWTWCYLWREEAGLVGRTSSPTTWHSSIAFALVGATREVPVSSRSLLGIFLSFSTYNLPCNILKLFNNLAPLTNLTLCTFSSSSFGGTKCSGFA
jgi:hypothetical protein